MMNDVFVERMVKKKLEAKEIGLIVLILLGVILLSLAGFVVGFLVVPFPMITVLVAAAAIFGGYQLIGMLLLEYETSLTNGFVSVDKIMNRSRRKRITSFECSSCEDIGKFAENEARLKNASFDTRVFATASSDRSQSWYMVVRSPKTGKTLLVLDADEELLAAIKKFIPRQLRFEKFGRGA